MERLSFRGYMNLDPLLIEGMLALSQRLRPYFEGEEPILLPQGQPFDLPYPGKHLEPRLPRSADPSKPRSILRPDYATTPPQILQQGGNFILKISDLKKIPGMQNLSVPDILSHYVRDQPYIAAYSQSSAENMAATIIFVLLTIRSDFMGVMQDFPVIMMELMDEYQDYHGNPKDMADKLKDTVNNLMGKMASRSPPALVLKTQKDAAYRKGYGMGGSMYGWKYRGIAQIWADRHRHYGTLMSIVGGKNTVAAFQYLNNITGLGMAKAGFCVQLLFGELGCIDMHNVNLYSQYYLNHAGQARDTKEFRPDHVRGQKMTRPADPRDRSMYALLDPASGGWASSGKALPEDPLAAILTGKSSGLDDKSQRSFDRRFVSFTRKLQTYIQALQELEHDGFNTIKLWDIWTAYVSRAYVTKGGGSRYARDGMFAGNPLDPENDPTDKKIMTTSDPIPDRNTIRTADHLSWKKEGGVWVPVKKSKGKALPTYTVSRMDKEKSAGAASLAHGATWWWRQPDYWWDLLKQAEAYLDGERRRPDDIFRYASADATAWDDDEESGYEQPSAVLAKPLAYLATKPEMIKKLFRKKDERKDFTERLNDVMNRLNFWHD